MTIVWANMNSFVQGNFYVHIFLAILSLWEWPNFRSLHYNVYSELDHRIQTPFCYLLGYLTHTCPGLVHRTCASLPPHRSH